MMDVKDVLQSNMCTGCGLCSLNREDMKIDSHGFLRPTNPIHDEISLKSCPGIKVHQFNRVNYDKIWGPIQILKTGYAADNTTRRLGSSGGVITAILQYLLHEKIVDEVIQVGESGEDPIRNTTKTVDDPTLVLQNAGSRYSPSAPLSVIRNLIGNGKKYAFVGKPCDVAALRSATMTNQQLKEQFPILLSFMCAGVPSEEATLDLLSELGVKRQNLASFRYRGDGWPGLAKAVCLDGSEKTVSYNDSWGKVLNKKLQPRCKICADGIGESADIVCADAWYEAENGYPSFEEKDGRSLVIARTDIGCTVSTQAENYGYIKLGENYPKESLKQIQPYQANRKTTSFMRMLALKLMGAKVTTFTGFNLSSLLFVGSPLNQIKAFVGTAVRRMKGRI